MQTFCFIVFFLVFSFLKTFKLQTINYITLLGLGRIIHIRHTSSIARRAGGRDGDGRRHGHGSLARISISMVLSMMMIWRWFRTITAFAIGKSGNSDGGRRTKLGLDIDTTNRASFVQSQPLIHTSHME